MLVTIKHINGNVLFSTEVADNIDIKIKVAVERAVAKKINLVHANLRYANLDGANLDGANLDGANLDGANLENTKLPSPTMILLANWQVVSDALCADLMKFDAANHPDPTKFDSWAKGGNCPYDGVNVERAALFLQKRELWSKGKDCRPYDLAMRCIAEKCPPEKVADAARAWAYHVEGGIKELNDAVREMDK